MSIEILLLVLVAALGLTAVARRINFPAPLLVTIVALLVSLIPGIPEFEMEPELILTLVLPPLLYSAALDISYQGFKQAGKQIRRLGVILVVVTAFAVGAVALGLAPELGFAAAALLGAVVAPPDAVSATAIGKRLGLPRKVMTLLSGESLINDAAALTLFTLFLTGVQSQMPTFNEAVLIFALKVVIGVGVGLVLGWLTNLVRMRLHDAVLTTAISLLLPFVAYIFAEQLGGSGVLAVVAAGLLMGFNSPKADYATRIQEQPIWASVDVILEALVFALIGLQLKSTVDALIESNRGIGLSILFAVAILVTVIVVRPLFIFGTYLPSSLVPRTRRIERRRRAGRADPLQYSWQELTVLSWTGMRGVVTLAAAASIPLTLADGQEFPGRELIIFTAFVVTVGTLLIQGTTLPWLINRLGVRDPGQEERDEAAERALLAKSMEHAWSVLSDPAGEYAAHLTTDQLSLIKKKFHIQSVEHSEDTADLANSVDTASSTATTGSSSSTLTTRAAQRTLFTKMRKDLIELRRGVLLAERDAGRIDDEVLRTVLRELDSEELSLDSSWMSRLPG